mmetsp:Transcript_22293/g.22082  ORF Transcript_22293/g.22082 Transcript_22293/m.22082 type:complete len:309 (-) Transcript_22293:49-975(-)
MNEVIKVGITCDNKAENTVESLRDTLNSFSEEANDSTRRIGILSKTRGMRLTNKRFYSKGDSSRKDNWSKFDSDPSNQISIRLSKFKKRREPNKIKMMTKLHIREIPLDLSKRRTRNKLTGEKRVKMKKINRHKDINETLKRLFHLDRTELEGDEVTKDTATNTVKSRKAKNKKQQKRKMKIFRIKKTKATLPQTNITKSCFFSNTLTKADKNDLNPLKSPLKLINFKFQKPQNPKSTLQYPSSPSKAPFRVLSHPLSHPASPNPCLTPFQNSMSPLRPLRQAIYSKTPSSHTSMYYKRPKQAVNLSI